MLKTLEDMKSILGDRKVSISREISKKYETTYRSTLTKISDQLDVIKGEYVIVVEGTEKLLIFQL